MKLLKKEYLQRNKLFLLLISFIFIQNCAHLKRETRSQPEKILTRVADVLKLYSQEKTKKNRLIADGKIKIETRESTHSFDFDVALHAPTSTRLELSHTLGGTLAILITNPQEYLFYDINDKVVHKGKDKISVVPNLFPSSLSPVELTHVLLNQFPLPQTKKNLDLIYDTHENAYQLSFLANSKKWRVLLDPTQFYLLEIHVLDLDESPYLSVAYYHFQKIKEGLYFPQYVKIDSPKTQASLLLRYESLSFEKLVYPHFFKLDVPEGVETIRN